MPSHNQSRSPAPIIYIGPVRRSSLEGCAVKLTHASGRVISASKIVQGLIDTYLDVYVSELTDKSVIS
ncbi:hypothetical protein DAPPPG734_25265 (plasmid) [Pantoea agglomerans]|uniref:Uncharacterized protein n=1 Tax=Enterobacter agglomerans TaxID=549 RepID=A0AAN2FHS5_ENTAG|nr:hypothetical protein DAPPPG734_25265 [Pantoea agglomerans]